MTAIEHQLLGGVDLVGAPSPVPRLRVVPSVVADGKLNIPYGNGYDHFTLDRYEHWEGYTVSVLVWSGRTNIAE